ncbi:MAG: S8 family serine peptidase [Rhodobacteraceae bacterium]|nr:S8 family serine peptidase [Paracoccaceae bacterium]
MSIVGPVLPLRRTRRLVRGPLALAATAALAGCGGSGEDAGGEVGRVEGFLPGLQVLSAAYVQSFAPYESLAATLRTSDPAFTRQSVTWFFTEAPSVVYDSFALASARFEYARAAGLTGAGQVVSVVDDGFRLSHEAFADTVITGSVSVVEDHGTAVAAIVAGNASQAQGDTQDFTGVAPGVALDLGVWERSGGGASYSDLRAAAQRASSLGAVAQNHSWGFPTVPATASGFGTVFASQAAQDWLAALTDYARQGVVVFSAPNDGSSATILDGLPVLRPDLEAGWLSVINADVEVNANRVTSATLLSAPCAQSARWCLAAEGVWEAPSAASDTAYVTADNRQLVIGTSFAAPQVTGALALLAQAFPTLTPHDLRVRLLASADDGFFTPDAQVELADGFIKGYSNVWGHGFLDLRAALLPIGTPRIQMADGSAVALDSPLVASGAAMGDAVARSLGAVGVLATDTLGGDFRLSGSGLTATTTAPPIGPALLSDMMAADPFAVSDLSAPGVLRSLSGQSLTLSDPAGEVQAAVLVPGDGGEDAGVALARVIDTGSGALSVGLTLGRDGGDLFGLGIGGAAPGADIAALDLGLTQDLGGGGFLRLGATMGVATGETDTRFNALSMELGTTRAAGDRLALGVSLPVATTSGQTTLMLPTSRGAGGLIHTPVSIDLAPQDRQVDLSLRYDVPLDVGPGGRTDLRLELRHALNHGHVAGATDTGVGLALRISF